MKTVVSLCDLTGNMAAPWIEAGYKAFLVDPQHGTTRTEGPITKFAGTIEEAMPAIGELIRANDVAMVFGFPPCTHLAVSGAKHFQRKMTDKSWEHYQGPNMWIDAMRIVQECANVGQLSGAPWFLENPVSRVVTLWRKPDHIFHPWQYTAYEAARWLALNTARANPMGVTLRMFARSGPGDAKWIRPALELAA